MKLWSLAAWAAIWTISSGSGDCPAAAAERSLPGRCGRDSQGGLRASGYAVSGGCRLADTAGGPESGTEPYSVVVRALYRRSRLPFVAPLRVAGPGRVLSPWRFQPSPAVPVGLRQPLLGLVVDLRGELH